MQQERPTQGRPAAPAWATALNAFDAGRQLEVSADAARFDAALAAGPW
jgi:hypothetical protein